MSESTRHEEEWNGGYAVLGAIVGLCLLALCAVVSYGADFLEHRGGSGLVGIPNAAWMKIAAGFGIVVYILLVILMSSPVARTDGLPGRRRNIHVHGEGDTLVLSRRIGERVVIDDRITVTVLDIRSGQIRLGVETPRKIPVRREAVVTRKETVAT